MKKMVFYFLTGFAFISCNSTGTESKEAMKDSTAAASTTTTMNYPYSVDHPDNWNMGSSANTMTALSALKTYQDGNVPESMKYFGDTVHIQFDGMDKKLAADSLQAMFTDWRKGMKTIDIKMSDWESVISKDKKEEWVTIWYRQKWEDTKGKKDSLDVIDDMQMKGGKIVRLAEYSRKLH